METALFLGMIFAAIPLAAGEHDWRRGDWKIAATQGGCSFSQLFGEYSNATDLKVLLFSDGRAALMLKNPAWSVKRGTSGEMDIVLDDNVFSGSAAVTNDQTVMMIPSEEMLAAIGTARFMIAFWNEQPTDHLPLDGGGAAFKRAQECLADVRAHEITAKEGVRKSLNGSATKVSADSLKGS